MNCSECHGTGWVLSTRPSYSSSYYMTHYAKIPCTAEGCHGGKVHCCDGENVDMAPERETKAAPPVVVDVTVADPELTRRGADVRKQLIKRGAISTRDHEGN